MALSWNKYEPPATISKVPTTPSELAKATGLVEPVNGETIPTAVELEAATKMPKFSLPTLIKTGEVKGLEFGKYARRSGILPGGPTIVRRPMMGLELKGERHAYLQVYDSNGDPIQLYNSAGGKFALNSPENLSVGQPSMSLDLESNQLSHYTDFILTTVQEQRTEKLQVVETFGEDYIYTTGEKPRMLSVSGYLCNSSDFPWRSQFWANYNEFLRGSKLVEKKYRAYFGWDDIMVEGFIVGAAASEAADNETIIRFNFTFLVSDYISLGDLQRRATQNFLERTDISAFMELVESGQHEIFSNNNIAFQSRAMRVRQYLAGAGGLANVLNLPMSEVINLINDPGNTATKYGRSYVTNVIDKLWEETQNTLGAKMQQKSTFTKPNNLTNREVFNEYYSFYAGLARRALYIAEKTDGTDTLIGFLRNFPGKAGDNPYATLSAFINNPFSIIKLMVDGSASESTVYRIAAVVGITMFGLNSFDNLPLAQPIGNVMKSIPGGVRDSITKTAGGGYGKGF